MEIIDFSEAMEIRKNNLYSEWSPPHGCKDFSTAPFAVKRLQEEYVNIWSETKFSISNAPSFFCIGSCFARRLEEALQTKEINSSTLKMMGKFPNILYTSRFFNKFSLPAIYQELDWSFNYDESKKTACIMHSKDDLYFDTQSVGSDINIGHYEEILKRRTLLCETTRDMAFADVVVITLGLTEVWYDHEMEYYYNFFPNPDLACNSPERFQLHVLSLQENIDYAEKIYQHIKYHNPSASIVITVSPVPLKTTFTHQDVVVANQRSKSTLLLTAHYLSDRYPDVFYFPSYEIANYSHREKMWAADLRHVKSEGANYIIEHFINSIFKY